MKVIFDEPIGLRGWLELVRLRVLRWRLERSRELRELREVRTHLLEREAV